MARTAYIGKANTRSKRLSAALGSSALIVVAGAVWGVLSLGDAGGENVARAQEQGSRTPAQGAQTDPNAAVDCYASARNRLRVADRTAFLLCNGARSTAPVQCFAAARNRTALLDWQIVALCRCATSTAPVACVERGHGDTFMTDDQVVALCSVTATQQLQANCTPLAVAAPQ